MNKKLNIVFALVVSFSMLLAACAAPAAPEAPAAEAPAAPAAEAPASPAAEAPAAPAAEAPAAEAPPAPAAEAPAAEEPAKETTLIYAIQNEPETYFPGYESSALASYGFELVFNNLATKDLEGAYVGDLAESWDVSEDKLTWTFNLVQNAAWHDGVPFTSEDVRYTFELLADPEYTGTYYTMVESIVGAVEKHDGAAENVSGINVIDDFTIAITTKEPNALVLDTMAGVMPILPAHVLSETPVAELANSDFARKPVGTGPFVLREWNAEESLIFDKNPTYFAGPANMDVFIWKIIPETSAQITALLNGEVHLINVAADDFPQVDGVDGIATKTTPGSRYNLVNFHHTDPLLADVRTRQAIAHAIDREAVLIGLYGGIGNVESCIFHPSLPEYNTELQGYAYDVELAKSMLAEVGWTDQDGDGVLEASGVEGVADGTKFSIEVGSTSAALYVKYNELLQQFLKEIGIESTIKPMETDIMYSEYYVPGGPWQMVGGGWSNLIGTPQQELLWNIVCDSQSQYDYCNEELDALIYANNSIFDEAERVANFGEILKIMERDVIYIATVRANDLYAFSANLNLADFQSAMDLYRSIPTWSWAQ